MIYYDQLKSVSGVQNFLLDVHNMLDGLSITYKIYFKFYIKIDVRQISARVDRYS